MMVYFCKHILDLRSTFRLFERVWHEMNPT